MFSGKTGRLIDELDAARQAGLSARALKHRLDRRYDTSQLATHDGRRFAATPVERSADVAALAEGVDVVGIDEGQFFDEGLVRGCELLRRRGQRVVVAGIDHDVWGRSFPPLPQLKEIADSVEVLHVPCTVCGRPARYSQRMVPVEAANMVGGPAEYQPRCAACFQPLAEAPPVGESPGR